MKFTELPLRGAFRIEAEPVTDERGYFLRTFDAEEFSRRGLVGQVAQCSVSYNRSSRTLRGLHYQEAPAEETKLVRCIRGGVYDVIVDLRPASPTRYRWHAEDLRPSTAVMLYIPVGFAHGFLTLEEDTELVYQISTPYEPALTRGVRWDDPAFAITWPGTPVVISARDAAFPWVEG